MPAKHQGHRKIPESKIQGIKRPKNMATVDPDINPNLRNSMGVTSDNTFVID